MQLLALVSERILSKINSSINIYPPKDADYEFYKSFSQCKASNEQ